MNYLVGFLLVIFLIGGLALIVKAVRDYVARQRLLPFLKKADGTIISIERKLNLNRNQELRERKSNRRIKLQYSFYPIISFRKEDGSTARFKSEIGDVGSESKYRVGQTIPLLYDPKGNINPLINHWSGIWGMILAQAVGGIFFILGSLLIFIVFGSRILGR